MRPRVFPAEDALHDFKRAVWLLSFNEAAGIPRGRRRVGLMVAQWNAGFNEAAGIPRGRPCIHRGGER